MVQRVKQCVLLRRSLIMCCASVPELMCGNSKRFNDVRCSGRLFMSVRQGTCLEALLIFEKGFVWLGRLLGCGWVGTTSACQKYHICTVYIWFWPTLPVLHVECKPRCKASVLCDQVFNSPPFAAADQVIVPCFSLPLYPV